ncbi:DUF6090 family protein [Polaribacter sp. MED152]|uniref:DUF6090 family protein n=1 Tax=Polaribacter sp. MED152 TaxID=313598 RepID=UPI000186F416|nr:DUF6090 family protein [Polaribacter sp. MED152]EAQ41261.2 hypothetical protein MED152_01065 [Polaribacter sp. MED152]
MIKFFRKIRQNLLMENKTGKYFKYAIGEIILVVIGILIALGINNWNENRKNKESEKIILNNINKNLTIDSVQFDYYKEQFKQIDKLHFELYGLAQNEQTIDSISEPLLIRRTLYFKQLVDSDFIQNIRPINNPKINEVFTIYVQRVDDIEEVYFRQLYPLIEHTLKPLLKEHKLYNTENWFRLKNRNFQKDYTFKKVNNKNLIDKNRFIELAKTIEFQQLLFELNAKWNEFNTRLEIVIEENDNFRKLITSELKNY